MMRWLALPLLAALGAEAAARCANLAPATCAPVFLKDKKGEVDFTAESYGANCRADGVLTHKCAVPKLGEGSFCNVKYPARLVMDANGNASGAAEDAYAKCMHESLTGALALYNCRDVQHWTCQNCTDAYKEWLCATVFPRCTKENGNPETDMVKPCRGVCHQVMRRCPAHLQFKCPPENDNRDYVPCASSTNSMLDASNCNAMGLSLYDACDVAR